MGFRILDAVLRFVSRTTDPSSGMADGDVFYRSDTDRLRVRTNGVWGYLLDDQHALPTHAHTGTDLSAIDAADITTGALPFARLPIGNTSTTASRGDHDHEGTQGLALDAAAIASGTFNSSRIPNLDTAKITTGTFAIGRIPTGTSSTTAALGNHNHAGVYQPADNYALANGSVINNFSMDDAIIAGAIDHNGSTAGFYGTAPIARPGPIGANLAVPASTTDLTNRLNAVTTFLKNLGLFS